MSAVPEQPGEAYCFDCCREVLQTELHMVGEDLIPTRVTETTSEPYRWMRYIIHTCFQHDLVVGVRAWGEC